MLTKLAIEALTRPLKKARARHATLSSTSGKIRVDLDRLQVAIDNQSIDLATIPGTKGGQRYFFECPQCTKRSRLIFKREGSPWACGACYKVHRYTLNRTKTDCQYYWTLALNEMRKIDPTAQPKRDYLSYDDFPSRPKRMKRLKYWQHYSRFIKYMDKGTELWLQGIKF